MACAPFQTIPNYAAHASGGKFQEVEVATDKAGHWRVEEEFIAAIRGTEKIRRTSFTQGVRYMEFTHAVATS